MNLIRPNYNNYSCQGWTQLKTLKKGLITFENLEYIFIFIFIQHIKGVRLKKCIQSICLWVVKVRLDTSILPYKMHYQEIICLQFARIYIFLIAKEKTSRTYQRTSTSKEPHIGHYSLLIRVSRRKATLVARCMVNAIT